MARDCDGPADALACLHEREALGRFAVDTERWLGRPLQKRIGIRPGGLHWALTVDLDGQWRPEMPPLEV